MLVQCLPTCLLLVLVSESENHRQDGYQGKGLCLCLRGGSRSEDSSLESSERPPGSLTREESPRTALGNAGEAGPRIAPSEGGRREPRCTDAVGQERGPGGLPRGLGRGRRHACGIFLGQASEGELEIPRQSCGRGAWSVWGDAPAECGRHGARSRVWALATSPSSHAVWGSCLHRGMASPGRRRKGNRLSKGSGLRTTAWQRRNGDPLRRGRTACPAHTGLQNLVAAPQTHADARETSCRWSRRPR